MHIENVNLTYLIYSLQDKEKAFQIALSLSETNYIYSPFIYRSMKEVNQIWGIYLIVLKRKNIMNQYLEALLRMQWIMF